MATYQLLMDFGSGYTDYTDKVILSDGFKLREAIGKDGTHEIQTCSFRLHNSLEISPLIFTAEDDIPAKVLKDGVEIFRGIIRPYASVEVIQTRVDPISLSILDESALLEQYVFESKVYQGKKVLDPSDTENSLLHLLFAEAGIAESDITTSETISEEIPWYKLEQGGYISDAIQDVCYEYGLQWRALMSGGYEIISIVHDEITAYQEVLYGDVKDSLQVEKADSSQKGVIVEYAPILYRTGATVFEADTDIESTIASGAAYPTGADDDDYRQYYDLSKISDDAELLYSENHVLTVESDGLAALVKNETYETDYCHVFLENNTGRDYTIDSMKVTADIRYRGEKSKAIVSGSNPKKYTARVVSTAGSAQYLARILAERQSLGKQKYKFSSRRTLTIGGVTRLTDNLVSYLDLYMIILSREYDHVRDLYIYTGQGIAVIDYTIPISDIKIPESVGIRSGLDGSAGSSPVPVRLYALGDADAPFDTGTRVADDTGGVADDTQTLGTGADWSLSRPTPGEGQYVWYVIGYYTPPSTWPTEWTTPVKDSGLNAYALQLSAPMGTTISMSGRGVLQTASLKFTAILSNILPGSVNWATSDGILEDVAGDAYSKTIDCSGISADSVMITISATIEGTNYSASVGVQRVWGTPDPQYAGVLDYYPTSMDGEPLVSGDTFLYIPADDTDEFYGHVMKYSGTTWASTVDSASIGLAAKDALEIARDTGKVIFAAVVYTQVLVAANLQAGDGTGIAGSGFRFRAMSDDYSSLGSPEVPVFDITYDDKILFKVELAESGEIGRIYFGENFWYDPADGSIQTPDVTADGVTQPGIKISAGGTIEGISSIFRNSTIYGNLVHNALSTQDEETGATENIPSPSRWKGSAFYDAMSSVSTSAYTNATGAFAKLARWTGAVGFYVINDSPGTEYTHDSSWDWTSILSERAPASPSFLRITFSEISLNGFSQFELRVKKNGSVIATQTWEAGDYPFNSSGYADELTYYKSLSGSMNDLFEVEIRITGSSTYYDTVTVSDREFRVNTPGQGVSGKLSSGYYKFYNYAGFYAEDIEVTSPNSFDSMSSSNKIYTSGAAILALMSAYTSGYLMATDDALLVSHIRRVGRERIRGDESWIRSSLLLLGQQLRLLHRKHRRGGATTGWYIVSGSYTLLSKQDALLTLAIMPKNPTCDIGGDGVPAATRFRIDRSPRPSSRRSPRWTRRKRSAS